MSRYNSIISNLDKVIKYLEEEKEKSLRSKTLSQYQEIPEKCKRIMELCQEISPKDDEIVDQVYGTKQVLVSEESLKKVFQLRMEENRVFSSMFPEADFSNSAKVCWSIKDLVDVDDILSALCESSKSYADLRLYELMQIWIHARFVENPVEKPSYKLEYVPGWMVSLTIVYAKEDASGKGSKLFDPMEEWTETIRKDKTVSYATPSFMLARNVKRRKISSQELKKARSYWKSFVDVFNDVSIRKSYNVSLEYEMFDNHVKKLGLRKQARK